MRFAVTVVALLVSTGISGRAADSDTLKNLRAVDVLIEGLPPEVERDGLTTAQIRADVEARLRQGGIQVSRDASEAFYVNVNAHRTTPPNAAAPEDRYMFNIQVDLKQPVMVVRTNALALATTWSRATVGTTILNRFPDSVRRDIGDVVDLFLDDYLLANPAPLIK